MRCGHVMDPRHALLPHKDTSCPFQRAAASRKHDNLHALPRDIYCEGGDIFATVRPVRIVSPPPAAGHPVFELGARQDVRLADVDAVLIRKDPPFDQDYLYTTLLLERLRGRTLLVNDPRGLREANEKLYTLHFPKLTARTLVTADAA